ncbi:alkylhydroperoxidase/carboxymuconolactone decarboxylase family protein YurZ [Orenia metallireducens]|jgi:alkylhydroperoxidase/carboxymuconolactone decarboxylase family protein YurZ|uniref:Uncharacterized conserved protein YurZ, alkylhydroperoxidase/carboxymuconolactone decarboxylase family n=1 Tax=Orenia metallireducens TaxID=1413210 RepID=A0A285I6A2_9FIRM|nr:carboxymuconolactone decarboxylase family protein [Orenia metallireducens]PRX23128.1 alkylhydroperoxidase/carboxymuconolactone decarboxylase family protein YurZ [Orenia metallireducens]SNY42481.1 Uncharacterized conserved protein YurZ, alkylhydroperoxidase/carboxymuconolactone decarboxylase family [Orenia metallireducens]
MQKMIQEVPRVTDSFFKLTEEITQYSQLDKKTKELILIGIFVAEGSKRGLKTHVERALTEGASKNEVISAIIFALPVMGISKVNTSIEVALEVLGELVYEAN